jgi:cholesterol oxidase
MARLNRRQFMGLSAGTTLGAIAAGTLEGLSGQAAADAATQTDYPAIIIGSGFGGAVAALRLGQAGVQTLILERGQQWGGNSPAAGAGQLPGTPAANAYSQTKEVFNNQGDISNKCFYMRATADWPDVPPVPMLPAPGVMEVSDQTGLAIGCGAAVGGGSIVYTGSTIAPDQKYYEQLYPSSITYAEMMNTWYPKAFGMLQPSQMPADILASKYFTHSQVWNTHITRAGYTPQKYNTMWNWDVIRNEINGTSRHSAVAGETDFGVSNGAKKSLDQTYLPLAVATGNVTIKPLTAVLSFTYDGIKQQYVINTHTMNTSGVVTGTATYTTKKLFVCAGTLNTNKLLVTARDSGAMPNLSSQVGVGFGDNGDQYSLYSYLGAAGPSQGSPSAAQIMVDDKTLGLPIRAESWQLHGAGTLPVVQTLIMTVDTDHRTNFVYNKSSKTVGLNGNWATNSSAAASTASKWVSKIASANSGIVPITVTWPLTLTAHPLGGMQLGGGATDLYGRVTGYPGLYVLDGSILPGNVGGGNPSFTITALAERGIANIIANGG